MIHIRGFALYGPLAASTRYRLEQYVPGLRSYGIELDLVYLLGDDYLSRRFDGKSVSPLALLKSGVGRVADLVALTKFDAAIVHCELMPLLPGWLETMLLRRPYIYDFDDAFYLRYRLGRMSALKPMLGGKFDHVIKGAARVTAGSHQLLGYARQFNKHSEFLPTVVDLNRYVPDYKLKTDTFTVGWIGSPSTAPSLQIISGPLEQLAKESPVRLVVIGGAAPQIPGVQIEVLPWCAHTEIELINSFDLGVMPLPDDDWSRGKCAFKLIQYMACAIPVVASAVGANSTVVTPECGYLASTDEEWLNAFRALRDSPERRRRAGEAGRQYVADQYSLQVTLPRLADVIVQVISP